MKECLDVCKALASVGCPPPSGSTPKDCAIFCVKRWRQCDAWPRLVGCMDKFELPVCTTTPACEAARTEVVSCGGPPVDAGTIECTPGEPIPPCVCAEGGSPPVKLCDPSGKAPACSCP